ncbi:MAG TPA: Hint domain-containing protein, partial [Stellaceae bacterium]|nr:Hint domain-containing protein [Stellaceae bacterium]
VARGVMSTISSGTTITSGIAFGTTAGAGTYTSPLVIEANAAIVATSGIAIYGPATQAWTLANDGTIGGGAGTVDVDVLAGIDLRAGGSIGNTGLITGYSGIYIYAAAGTVSNSGTILGGTGASGWGIYFGAGGTVTNSAGTIAGRRSVEIRGGGSVANTGAGRIAGAYAVYIGGGIGRVTNGGTILGTSHGAVELWTGGYVGNTGTGLIEGFRGVYIRGGIGTVANSATIIGTSSYGVRLATGGTVVDSGRISGGTGTAVSFGGTGGNLLVLEPGYGLGGGVYGSTIGTDTIELAGTVGAAVTASYNGLTLTNFENVLFGGGGHATLVVTNISGTLGVTISGFDQTSEAIDLTVIGSDGTISNFDTLTNLITVSGSGGTVTFQLDGSDAASFTTAPDGAGGTELTPVCYCRGTLILTPAGEVAVEDLAIGDLVMTLSGAARPVKWIGRRAYDGRFVADNRAVLPVRITAGALADGVPARELRVSPGHALYFDGELVRAEHLLNGATIVQEAAGERVEYFHIELETHDILFADGAPAESYADCDNRGKFHNAGEFAALYPDDAREHWQYCAPLLQWEAAGTDAIRAALLARATALGHALDLDPDLHLVVDGAVIRPVAVEDRVWRFRVPAGSAAVALASRSVAPAEVWAETRDRRRLGVPVERLVLDDGDLRIEAGHGHERLNDGFHADEPTHRWTDGLAHLPEAWLAAFPGAVTLEVRLFPNGLPYRLPPPAAAEAA